MILLSTYAVQLYELIDRRLVHAHCISTSESPHHLRYQGDYCKLSGKECVMSQNSHRFNNHHRLRYRQTYCILYFVYSSRVCIASLNSVSNALPRERQSLPTHIY